jgi:hypothetical protein
MTHTAFMHRSFLRFTRTLLLPLLAVGLVLTGCDSSGSNGDDPGNTPGDDPGDDPSTFAYPTTTYGEQTVVNLLAFDLGVRASNASDNDAATFDALYNGNADDRTIRAVPAQNISTEGQSVYGDIASGVNLADLTSDDDLIRSDRLEEPDSPDAGSLVNTDELLGFYFQEAGANNVGPATSNGFVLNQFAEKMLLGTPIYGRGAEILDDFADDDVDSDRAEQWDAAFGYFGFPRALEPFLDYANGEEGLASGNALDVDDNGSVDLTSEYVHTWASYAIERSAAAENNGQPNDFARDAFEALVEGREDIENGDDPTEHAEEALQAWEEVVAVNVIHYINSMKSNLEGVNGEISEGDVGEDAWGEAKAFAWNLQFYSDELDDDELNTLHELIGNDPPYGDLSADQYTDNLNEANQLLEDAYDFNGSNVDVW